VILRHACRNSAGARPKLVLGRVEELEEDVTGSDSLSCAHWLQKRPRPEAWRLKQRASAVSLLPLDRSAITIAQTASVQPAQNIRTNFQIA